MALAADAVHVTGEWIRHAPHRSDLLGRSPEPTDGRWQRGEVVRDGDQGRAATANGHDDLTARSGLEPCDASSAPGHASQ